MSIKKPNPHLDLLKVEIKPRRVNAQDLNDIGLVDANLLDILAQFEEYGVWRFDIDDGLFYFSKDAAVLHGMVPQHGPIDLTRAVAAYHADDRHHVMECLEDAIERKSGFRFVLRIDENGRCDPPRIVETTGRYRLNRHGRPELYGTVRQVRTRVRSVSLNN